MELGWYSYKWRNYDPAIARFMSIDPLTEEYEDYTPYQFSSNQPVHAKELEGLESSNDLNKNKQTPTQRAYNPKTGNTDLLVFVKEVVSDFVQSINTYSSITDKEITTTVTSKNARGDNPKSTGKKVGDNFNGDAFLIAAPGLEKNGNNLKTLKDMLEAGNDLKLMFEKGQKIGNGVNEVIEENENKKEKSSDMVQTVNDSKNPNKNEFVRRDILEEQQKKK